MNVKYEHEPIRWRAMDESHFLWRTWKSENEDETLSGPLSVLYCLDSDDTHLMNNFGTAVIHALQEKPLSISELQDKLAKEFFPLPELQKIIPAALIERFIQQMVLSGIIFEERIEKEIST